MADYDPNLVSKLAEEYGVPEDIVLAALDVQEQERSMPSGLSYSKESGLRNVIGNPESESPDDGFDLSFLRDAVAGRATPSTRNAPSGEGGFDMSDVLAAIRGPASAPKSDSGFLDTLLSGGRATARAAGAAIDLLQRDNEDLAKAASAADAANLTQDKDLFALKQSIASAKDRLGDDAGWWETGKELLSLAAQNPRGAGLLLTEQLPNSAAALAGGGAGALAGSVFGPVGTIVGGITGLFGANYALEGGNKAIEAAQNGPLTDDDFGRIHGEGVTKAGVITLTDVATMGLGGKIFGAAQRAVDRAGARVLTEAGVDVTDKAAIAAAIRENPALIGAVQAAEKGAFDAATTLSQRALRGGAAMSLETLGEGVGEYWGEGLATGKWDKMEAMIEAFSSLGQSGAEASFMAIRNKVDPTQSILSAPDIQSAIKAADEAIKGDVLTAGTSLERAVSDLQNYDSQQRDIAATESLLNGPVADLTARNDAIIQAQTSLDANAELARANDAAMAGLETTPGFDKAATPVDTASLPDTSAPVKGQQSLAQQVVEAYRAGESASNPIFAIGRRDLGEAKMAELEKLATGAFQLTRAEQAAITSTATPPISITPNQTGTHEVVTQTPEQAVEMTQALKEAGVPITPTQGNSVRIGKRADMGVVQSIVNRINTKYRTATLEAQDTVFPDVTDSGPAEQAAAPAQPAAPAFTTTNHRDATDLKEMLARDGIETEIRIENFNASNGPSKVLNGLAKLLGKKIVFFSASSRAPGAAVRSSPNDNRVWINVNDSVSPLRLLGHETLHKLKQQSPNAYKTLRAAMAGTIDEGTLTKQWRDYYAGDEKLSAMSDEEIRAALSDQKTREDMLEEMLGDLAGNRFAETEFWQQVFDKIEKTEGREKAKGLIAKLKEAVLLAISKLQALFRGGEFKADQFLDEIEHLDGVRKALSTAYAQYIQDIRKTGMDENAAVGVGEAKFANPKRESTIAKENKEGVIVGARPGEFDWSFAKGGTPAPIQHPTQMGPRLDKIGPVIQKILDSEGFRKLAKDAFGITNLKVYPILGQYKGQPEPSFAIYGDGMTFDAANDLSKMIGFAFAQESTIVTQPVYAGDSDTWPAYYVGNGKKLTEAEIDAGRKFAQESGLDYSTSIDGTSFKFFFDGSDIDAYSARVADFAKSVGLKNIDRVQTRSKFNEAANYLGSEAEGAGRQVWHSEGSPGSPSLFGRTVDHLLIPYAKAVGAEGYRFSPDLFADRFGLSPQQREYIRDALRPKSGKERSTSSIVSGDEKLEPSKSDLRSKNPKSNNTDIMWALQNRAAQTGLIEPGDYSDHALKVISEAIADEVAFHISRPGGKSAIGWYDSALAKAKEAYDEVFPELRTDKNKEMMFDAILGITSQGNDVHSNSVFAGRVYYLITREGNSISQAVEKLYGTFGGETRAIENNLLKLEQLMDRNGYDRMRDLMNQKRTVGEWNAILRRDESLHYNDKPLKVEGAARQIVNGWMVFGPKIGSFINNLHGDYSTLTADLWFSRTWNRILGFSFLHTPMQEAPKYQAFKEALIAEHTKTTEPRSVDKKGKAKAWEHGRDISYTDSELDAILADPDAMLSLATELEEKYRKGFDFDGKKKSGYSTKSDLRRAAKNWIEHRNDSVAAPRNDSERAFQQDAVDAAQKILKKRLGQDITIADIQAALWYHEKELFGMFGAGDIKSAPADYADAANKFMDRFNDGDMFYVEKPSPRYIIGEKGSYLKNGGDAKLSTFRAVDTESAEFKRWFGDSKVVDADGKPLVVYRGERQNVTTYKKSQLGKTLGGSLRKAGFFFTPSKEEAGFYAQMRGTDVVSDVYLSIENPFVVDSATWKDLADWGSLDTQKYKTLAQATKAANELVAAAKENGHDGLFMMSSKGEVAEYVAFEPTQIKSATSNTGEFSDTNPDIRYSTTRTPEFRNWFGSSVIKDADGKPRVMYHGTARDISTFRPKQADAIFLTFDPVFAEDFSDMSADWINRNEGTGEFDAETGTVWNGQNIMPLYVRAENPFDFRNPEHTKALEKAIGHKWKGWTYHAGEKMETTHHIGDLERGEWDAIESEAVQEYIRANHDSFWVRERGTTNLAVLDPNQVKSASGNTGEYSRENNDIRYSTPRQQPWYYSALENGLRDKVPEKLKTQPAAQWVLWLRSNFAKIGAKKDELEWSGVLDYLAMRGKDKVSAEELADWVANNGVKVNDVMLGESTVNGLSWGEWSERDEYGDRYVESKEGWRLVEDSDDNISIYDPEGEEIGGTVIGEGRAKEIAAKTASGEADARSSTPKFDSYVLPGGENYKELLLTLPARRGGVATDGAMYAANEQRTMLESLPEEAVAPVARGMSEQLGYEVADMENAIRAIRANKGLAGKEDFRSPHFDQLNILAHIRFNERTDAEGRRVLFIEELQSDWGQKGKKEGFAGKANDTEEAAREWHDMSAKLWNSLSQWERDNLRKEYREQGIEKNDAGVPAAPFVTDTKAWTALALKRAIAYAADNGFDAIAWTTGEQQAERYNLSKQLDSIQYKDNGDGTYHVTAKARGAGIALDDNLNAKQLEDTVGKEIAKKIADGDGKEFPKGAMQAGYKSLTGLDLKVGGEGMKGYYDQIVPQVAKKLGAEVVEVNLLKDSVRKHDRQIMMQVAEEKGPNEFRSKFAHDSQPGFTITNKIRGPQVLFSTQRAVDTPSLSVDRKGDQSFEVSITVGGEKVGRFLFNRTRDDFVSNDAHVDEEHRDKGYGKLLLLKAMEYAEDAGIWFEQDQEMVSKKQKGIYASLLKNKLATFNPSSDVWMVTDSGRRYISEFSDTNHGIRYSSTRIIGNSGRQHTAEQLQAFKDVGRIVDEKTTLEKLRDFAKRRWVQGIFDQFAPFRGTTAYTLLRLAKGANGAFEAFMKHGKLSIRDGAFDADTSGGVLNDVFIPLGRETTDFLYWIAANRAERLAMEGKERLFTPQSIKALKDLASGTADFDYVLSNGQVTRDRSKIYADSLKKFNEYNKNIMDMAEQSGLIDGASRHLWEHEFYVPFYRVMEDEESSIRGMNIKQGAVRQKAFEKLKGGEDKLGDLLSNTLMNWAHIIDASSKNRAAKAAIDAAKDMGVASKAIPGEKKTVWFMDGGKKVEYKVSDAAVMDAITGLEYAGMNNLAMRILQAPKHWLTVGVTASPFFKVRNLIRDSVQAIATSDLSYNAVGNVSKGSELVNLGGSVKNFLKAAAFMRPDQIKMSQEYVSALAGGGLIRFGTMLEGNESSRTRQLIKQGSKDMHILDGEGKLQQFYDKWLEPAVAAYNELGNRGEEINRMSLYNQLTKRGIDHATASLMARDLMDFSLQGSWTTIRFLAQVVPFFNARMQGLYKLGRATKENRTHMAVMTMATGLFGLALMGIAAGDDDKWKEWMKREEWDRDNYWFFSFAGEQFRIPKPFEIGAVATLFERSVETAFLNNERDKWKRFGKSIIKIAEDQLAINPVPQMIKPIVDIYANKDSFTGRPIEGLSMQNKDKEHRFNSNTSMPARLAAEYLNPVLKYGTLTAFDGLSPVQYDHLVRGYFAWMGATSVGAADMAARAMSNEPTKPALDYWKLATGNMVQGEESAGSRYVSQVYEQARELEQAYSTYRSLLKDGKVAEAKEYREDNAEKLRAYRSVESVKKELSKISERIRMVERSNKDADAKRNEIGYLRRQQNKLAERLAR